MENRPSKFSLIIKSAFLLFLIWVFILLVLKKTPYIFIDNVNLLIHEAGHLIFNPLGIFIGYLGGTLMQLTIPSAFTIYFLLKSDFFEFSFCFFWLGENFINISYYIADAKTQMLPLIGGGTHDWTYILTRTNLIDHATFIGNTTFYTGALLMTLSLVFNFLHIISDYHQSSL